MKTRNIPREIVYEEILGRLPVRSLLRFRCVSKQWCASISDPNFSSTESVVIILHLNFSWPDQNTVVLIVDKKSSVEVFPFPFPNKYNRRLKVRMWNSYGGLLLLSQGNDIYLFNPSTRDVKLVTTFPHHMREDFCGVCCDPVTRNFKVILMIRQRRRFSVFSFPSQIWKDVECDHSICSYNDPVNVRGVLYFLASKFPLVFCFVYFDSINDKFIEMRFPEKLSQRERVSMVKFDGCLALSCWVPSDKGMDFEIWVMKEHGVEESWTNLFRLDLSGIGVYLCPKPLLLTDDGEVLLQVANLDKIQAFNLKTQSCKDITIPPQFNLDDCFKNYSAMAVTYLPSLIPPP